MNQELLNKLINGFSTDNPRQVYTFNEDVSPEFYQEIREIHGSTLPNDFIFETIFHCLDSIKEYQIINEDQLDEHRGEIVDTLIPIATHKQQLHFQQFPEFAEQAKIDNLPPDATINSCIEMGCYLHIDEILSQVWDFLNK